MDSRRQGLLASTGIPHSTRVRSIVKALPLPGREDTGLVGQHHKVDILELDTALVASSTHLDHMGSLRPARADGVATLQGTETYRRIGLLIASQ